jgi:hypothetical protein
MYEKPIHESDAKTPQATQTTRTEYKSAKFVITLLNIVFDLVDDGQRIR